MTGRRSLPRSVAEKETQRTKIRQRLFDPSRLVRLEIPPVEVNSSHSVDAAAWAQSQASQHDAVNGVATTVRNSQLDKSASATTRQSLSQDMREATREGMCREQSRFEKNDRNFPQRRRPR
jgi:hypothetical protein